MKPVLLLVLLLALSVMAPSTGVDDGTVVLLADVRHLRSGTEPEWAEFAASVPEPELTIGFDALGGASGATLSLRQVDVKRDWRILLNDSEIGRLEQDENAMVVYREIPPGVMRRRGNELRIAPSDSVADDIRVGRIMLYHFALSDVLAEASLEIAVTEAGVGRALPARITVVDGDGALQTVAADPLSAHLAVRPGIVYSGTGRAAFTLPAGDYTVYASRGFEYSVDSARVEVRRGDRAALELVLRREVPTEGWIAADPHVHTLTYSGHGDASARERVLTLAGEGIELPVLTEHNRQVDLDSTARASGLRAYFTPVVGNEVTTPVGHFNIFPMPEGGPVPDHAVGDWQALAHNIRGDVVILNHARDVHLGFRPFGPRRHMAAAGLNRDGWILPANAMEVVNSGAQQTDVRRLFFDWFGMLNAGVFLTPVGSSDSHDVGRYVVGQARTYIRAADENPGHIDVEEAVRHFREGRVGVSFGLLPEITVNGRYGPGDLVPLSGQGGARLPGADSIVVDVRVLGPGWTTAERVALYANGREIRAARISSGDQGGLKWSGRWVLPRPAHDVFLVAMAEGPGDTGPFWPIAKPYQPASPEWNPMVVGATGAVWIDADGDGEPTSAAAYARRLVAASHGRLGRLMADLQRYDRAVAVQAAALLYLVGVDLESAVVSEALKGAAPSTRAGFAEFIGGLHEGERE